jgi:hypothetical protein
VDCSSDRAGLGLSALTKHPDAVGDAVILHFLRTAAAHPNYTGSVRLTSLIVFIRLSATSPHNANPKFIFERPVAPNSFDTGAARAFSLDSSFASTKNSDV